MANICYSAVVTANKKDFIKVMNYLESHSYGKFLEKMGDNDENPSWTDYVGFAHMGKNHSFCCGESWIPMGKNHIFRFESSWTPPVDLANEISKKCEGEIEFWYQESGCGFAGMMKIKGGELIEEKDIPCDISDIDMQLCLMLTDWDGINWSYPIDGNHDIHIKSGVRYPGPLDVYVEMVEEEEDGSFKYILTDRAILKSNNVGEYIEKMKSKYMLNNSNRSNYEEVSK